MFSTLKSLQWKLVFIFISITFALMTAVYVLLNHQVEASFYENFKMSIELGLDYRYWDTDIKPGLELMLSKNTDSPDTTVREEVTAIERAQREINTRFNLTDGRTCTVININDENRVVFTTDRRYNNNELLLRREIEESPNFIRALAEGKGDRRKIAHTVNDVFFDYAVMLKESGAVMYFRYYKSEWGTFVNKFNRILVSSSFFAVIASLIIGYILSKTITSPIMNIAHRARKIAEGDFGQDLEVKSGDEIGKLTGAFNFMSAQLKKTLTEVTSEKSKIEAILMNMSEGVVAFNVRGEIIHVNPAAEAMFGPIDRNLKFNEFAETFNIDIKLEDIIYLGTARTKGKKDIEAGQKTLRMNFALFTDDENKVEGIILVFHDITELQMLDNMRKEFVANVSHELNTPLAAIKSYAETLLDVGVEDRETAMKFLGVINSEAERMTRLVRDLLSLSRLDSSKNKLNLQQVHLDKLVKECTEKVRIDAVNKKQVLESYVIGEIPPIQADRDRLEQVVLNLLSNALKYTPEGGRITVYIGKTYGEVYFKVADTGIGIPKEDLPRIFERFYRVDKARSRKMGGTGLGLSIAKEIVESHGGNISITSEVGKGSEVTVRLPVNPDIKGFQYPDDVI